MTWRRWLFIVVAALAGLTFAKTAWCVDQGFLYKPDNAAAAENEPLLQPYEPITASYTKNSNDVPFLDVTLSLKYRVLPLKLTGKQNRAFFAMTTRFGFYWGTRDGSPVIGKSYNPKLIWRYLPDETYGESSSVSDTEATADKRLRLGYAQFVDFAYAHESNGQLIHTEAEYVAAQQGLQQPQYVNDNIHRGWDYLQVVWKKTYSQEPKRTVSSYLDLKYFLPVGLLQGAEDEYHTWEANPQGKPRKSVDGLTGFVKYQWYDVASQAPEAKLFSRPDLLLMYETGYHSAFKYSTVRAEFGFQVSVLPLAFWMQSGYMSDLALYYEKVNSFGIELRVLGF